MEVEISMKGDNPVDENSVNGYGIAAALAETLEAAVFADGSAAMKAYEMIERFAYGSTSYNDNSTTASSSLGSELRMSHFIMRDSQGNLQDVSIPLITMMPLPLLHVTEATFDIDLDVKLHTHEQESNTMVSPNEDDENVKKESPALTKKREEIRQTIAYYKKYKAGISAREHGQRASRCATLRYELETLLKTESQRASLAIELTPSTVQATGTSFVLSQNSKEDENLTSTHIRVNVKMEQYQLPDGIKALLQAAANSLSVKPIY